MMGSMLLDPQHAPALLDAARDVIRRTLAGEAVPDAAEAAASPALLRPAGCFVSLHERGTHRLRGCVGRLEATRPLIHAVRRAAAGVLDDPRFADDRVALAELPRLEIEVSILSPLRPAAGPLAFEPLTDGVSLTVGKRTACFLPQVARETGWSREELLSRLCTEKLGMPPDAWRLPSARLEIFNTQTIGPEPFEA